MPYVSLKYIHNIICFFDPGHALRLKPQIMSLLTKALSVTGLQARARNI